MTEEQQKKLLAVNSVLDALGFPEKIKQAVMELLVQNLLEVSK